MKLRIRSMSARDPEQLRTLLIDAADELAGAGCRVLEPKLSWDGHPILLVDARLHPVLVSFDAEHGDAALLNGLKNIDQLARMLPWINQVYDSLKQQQRPPRLIVVSEDAPPGAAAILSTCAHLSLFRCRILNINDDTGLWLERVIGGAEPEADATPAQRPAPTKPYVVSAGPRDAAAEPVDEQDALPSLSDEESAYFQQL